MAGGAGMEARQGIGRLRQGAALERLIAPRSRR
jgi:hypothetical protein